MTPASVEARTASSAVNSENGSHRLAGLAIVSLLPALFWTTVLAVGGNAVGQPLDPLALATIGAAIAAFLAAVVTAGLHLGGGVVDAGSLEVRPARQWQRPVARTRGHDHRAGGHHGAVGEGEVEAVVSAVERRIQV